MRVIVKSSHDFEYEVGLAYTLVSLICYILLHFSKTWPNTHFMRINNYSFLNRKSAVSGLSPSNEIKVKINKV